MSAIYSISPAADGVALDKVWAGDAGGLAAGYSALVPVQVGDVTALFAYDRASGATDVYTLTGEAPWLQKASARPDLTGQAWDSLSTFVLGNEPYLLAYEAVHGTFGFYRVSADLTVSKPYSFAFARNTPTAGFSTVAPYSSLGEMFFVGYSFDTGIVANFSLTVTATSAGGVPPLLAQNIWYHQWARAWTHFAFFQLGGANFFFKINTGKLNVNIDHMQDNPAMGSVEVGSYLEAQLPDALAITNAAHVPWANGEPRVLTYVAGSGKTVIYRIHSDCQGWTALGSDVTEIGATNTITYRIGAASFVLLY
jgi:hypothetical protein